MNPAWTLATAARRPLDEISPKAVAPAVQRIVDQHRDKQQLDTAKFSSAI